MAIAPPLPAEINIPQARRGRWGLGALAFLLVVAGLGAAGYFFLPQARDNLIALVVPPTSTPPPTPDTVPDQLIAIATLNSRGGVAPPYDVTARLRQALEGEIEAEGLAGARLATLPDTVRDAVRAYTSNLRTTSLYEAYLNRGLAQLTLNADAAAKADFQRAQQIGDGRAEAWRATCWAYALEQQPQAALPFCEASATRDGTGWSLDTRGIVYAELGRYADAANELENFMRWLDTQPSATRAMFAPTRSSWIDTLRAGKNPFDVATLNALRGAP